MEKKKRHDELILEAKGFFEAHKKEIGESVRTGDRVIFISFPHLIQFSPQLSQNILDLPEETIAILETALDEFGIVKNPRVRITNIPESHKIRIREIRAKHLDQFLNIEGIVRQASDVRPQVVNARFECPSCGAHLSVLQIDNKFREPNRCTCQWKGGFKLLSKEMVDAQRLVIEEAPDALEGGEQPRRINIFLKEDLVDPKMEERTTPGSRIKVFGVLKEVPIPLKIGSISTRFDIAVEANNVIPLEESFEDLLISEEEIKEILELAADKNIYKRLAQSIAPSIYGFDLIKEAVLLQMFGGVKKKKSDAGFTRGDIHVLLVGDPGCLVGDERVALGNGTIKKIKDFGSSHLEQINTQILTGEGGKKRDIATVFHAYKSQPIIEIITESGKSIKGTSNHPLMSVFKEESQVKRNWKRLDEFKVGDRVATVKTIPCTITKPITTNFKPLKHGYGPKFKGTLPKIVSEEFGALLGYLVGDGWVTENKVGFVVAEPEIDILPKLLQISKKLFKINPSLRKRKLSNGRKVQTYYIDINSKDIAKNLAFLKDKRVPQLINNSGNKVVSAFLRWLYEADGCVFNNGRGRRSVSLKAKNIELLRDVQILLLRFGIHSRIIENNLAIRRGKEIIKFDNKIGFASKKKKEKLKNLAKDAHNFARFNSQRSEKIVKIIRHPPQDVFDIEVPKTNRFIANGIISHNTAKSVMLKFISIVAPKGRYVSGKSASAAGLTAAVIKDEFLRGWSLEAGAMVLANKGTVCIDEIEKMNEQDRSAMHESLEQQSVTVSKANIHATLRAETTVLAAGNPKMGRFDPFTPIPQQIDISPALLSRFDVIFVIRDLPNKIQDEAIASHVLEEHTQEVVRDVIPPKLLRKYISYAKQKIKPHLTEEASKEILNFYVNLRSRSAKSESEIKPIPMTPRQLEGLIRLSEACAKLRLSETVAIEDARKAIELLKLSLTQVGYDEETQSYDIDKMTTGITASKRSKILVVREIIAQLESRLGKLIPVEEIQKEIGEKMSQIDFEDSLSKLEKEGFIFKPKKGFIQRM